MEKSAEQAGTVINAVLFGALAGANVLDIERRHFEQAIKISGKSLDANMRGFELGFAAARGDMPVAAQIAENASPDAMAAFPEFPVETRYTIENGFRRCQDYQSRSYAEGYLAKVRELAALDRSLEGATRGWKLTIEGARYLALRMTYEDVIRVADLKTRRDRFASVRNDAKAKADEPILITEYLKPGPEEICALLPPRLGNIFLNWLRQRGLEHRFNIGLYVKSHTISGFLMMRALARMRFLRLKSWRYAEEFALTSRWFDAVKSAARVDYRFGVEVAECADLVKGYSQTYRRGVRNFDLIFTRVIEPAIAEARTAAEIVHGARLAAVSDPEGDALDKYLVQTTSHERGAIASYA
jgi:indolepyruvate ferredoxin oxidoreductase beta subunit